MGTRISEFRTIRGHISEPVCGVKPGQDGEERVNPREDWIHARFCAPAPRRQFLLLRAGDGVEAHQVQFNALRRNCRGVDDHGGTEDLD
jgi:hypothetical protein